MTILADEADSRSEETDPSPTRSPTRRRILDASMVAVLAGVAIALRIPGLTSDSPYRDDAWPALATRTGLGRALRLGVTTPGFEATLRLWLGIEDSTWWAQVPVLAASVAVVVGAYLLARRIGCAPVAAVVGAGILALSPIAIVYGTRVKPYSFDALTSLATVAAALWVWASPARAGRWATLVGVATVAALFSASVVPVGVGCIGVCSVRAFFAGRRERTLGVAATGLFALFVVVYAAVVLPDVPPPLHRLWSTGFVDWSSPSAALESSIDLIDNFVAGVVYRHGSLGPLLLAAAAIGAVATRRDVAAVTLAPVLVALAAAAASRVPLGGGRTDLYLYPGIALAATVTVDGVVRWARRRVSLPDAALASVMAAGVAVAAVTIGREHVRLHPYPGVDMARLSSTIEARRAPGDGIVVSPYSRYPWALVERRPVDIVMDPGMTTGFTVASRDPDQLILPAEYVEVGYDPTAAARFAESRRRVWYVVTDTPVEDTPAEAQSHEYDAEKPLLAAGFAVVERVDVRGGHADLLERR